MPETLDEAFDIFEELFTQDQLLKMASKLKSDPNLLSMVKNYIA